MRCPMSEDLKIIESYLTEAESRTRLSNEPEESIELDRCVKIVRRLLEGLKSCDKFADQPDVLSEYELTLSDIAKIIGDGK